MKYSAARWLVIALAVGVAACGKTDDTPPGVQPPAASAPAAPPVKAMNLSGTDGNDQLVGGEGADHLTGGPGADVLDGRGGYDYARYDNATVGVVASLTDPKTNTGDAAGDTYVSIDALVGSAFDDQLTGSGGLNDMHGFAGNDLIWGLEGGDGIGGEEGDDTLDGGSGGDTLDGGPGNDTYVLRASEAEGDIIVQFDGAGPDKGDSIVFVGYGAKATLTKATVGNTWQVKSADGMIAESFEIKAGGDALDANDYRFVNSFTMGGAATQPVDVKPATTPASPT